MTPKLKHWAVVLGVLLVIPCALPGEENQEKAAKPEKGAKAAAREPGKWIPLLSKDTKSLDEHWKTTGNWSLADGVATLTPREGEEGWSRWTAYLWSKEQYEEFDIEFEYKLKK